MLCANNDLRAVVLRPIKRCVVHDVKGERWPSRLRWLLLPRMLGMFPRPSSSPRIWRATLLQTSMSSHFISLLAWFRVGMREDASPQERLYFSERLTLFQTPDSCHHDSLEQRKQNPEWLCGEMVFVRATEIELSLHQDQGIPASEGSLWQRNNPAFLSTPPHQTLEKYSQLRLSLPLALPPSLFPKDPALTP